MIHDGGQKDISSSSLGWPIMYQNEKVPDVRSFLHDVGMDVISSVRATGEFISMWPPESIAPQLCLPVFLPVLLFGFNHILLKLAYHG